MSWSDDDDEMSPEEIRAWMRFQDGVSAMALALKKTAAAAEVLKLNFEDRKAQTREPGTQSLSETKVAELLERAKHA